MTDLFQEQDYEKLFHGEKYVLKLLKWSLKGMQAYYYHFSAGICFLNSTMKSDV
jgi:hypothetical protein